MPWASSSSTSSWRDRCREPVGLRWARSSTTATAGRRDQHRVEVELLDLDPADDAGATGHDLEPLEHGGRAGPAPRVGVGDDDVGAPLVAASRLVEHGVGLAHAGGGAEVDPQPAPTHVVEPTG